MTATVCSWVTADANTTNNTWAADSTNAGGSMYQFNVRSGTAADACDTWNWITTDVTWVTQTVHPWSSEEAGKIRKKQLKERWGVEEMPKLTVEEAREVELNSEKFLADVLSPDELVMFKAENKVRVESGLEPEVHYIVKRVRLSRIERYVKGKLVETLGFHACWQELPELDILATKVFDLKHNEAMVLKRSCKARVPLVSA